MDWRNSYSSCENIHIVQSSLQVQCNTYHDFDGIFTEIEKKILKSTWNHKHLKLPK